MKKVLVADPISQRGVDELVNTPGVEVVVNTGLKPEALLQIIADFDGLIVRSQTKVTPAVLAQAKRLKVVGRAGVGVDNIDVAAATDCGVVVMNTPMGNTISTAEHAFSLMLSMCRHIPQAHASMRAGKWDRKSFEGIEVYGKRLAVLGMGRIGSEFAKRAQAFGMHVVAYDPFLSQSRARSMKVDLAETVEQALSAADFVTLHMPLTEASKHILNKQRMLLLNKGACIVNCARGGLVDEAALQELLDSAHLGGAAMDVYEIEPPAADYALLQSDKCVFTPHLGASTAEAQENVGIEVALQVRDFMLKGEVRNAVNMPNLDPKTLEECGKLLELGDAIGRLASFMGPQQPDALRINYYGKAGEADTDLITRSVVAGYLSTSRNNQQLNLVNAPAVAKSMGLRVTESVMPDEADYSEYVEVEVVKGEQRYKVGGTLFGSIPRIVSVNGYGVEMNTKGNFLIVENDDTPGMVGLIGTLLGSDALNIANMTLSRNNPGGCAMTIIELDGTPSALVLEILRKNNAIKRAQAVSI